ALGAQPGGPPAVEVAPEQAAYVIFTSGTTGQPKAVVNLHHSLTNLARAIDRVVFAQMQPEAGLRISCNASFAFDASVHQIFTGLLNGHAVCIAGAETRREPARLHAFVEAQRLDLVETTPSFMALLVDYWREQGLATSARTCILGGEVLSAELVRAFFALPGHADVRLINAYGPTECCVAVSHYDLTARNWQEFMPPPIGRPIPGVRVDIHDQAGRPLPEGVPGQIVIGGEGVGRGYLGDAELTARRFSHDARTGRWYQSGDLGRWLPGGLLQFMGREDRQVKIRGNRIELAEVEAAISAHPLVKRVAVAAIDPFGDGNRLLAAYVVPRPGFDPAALKAELDASQPSYLVPSWLLAVDEIPLTPNGKVDEARLPRPAEAAAQRPPARPLAGETEQRLAAIWSTVLQVRVDDADADFFSLGGHSVLAVRLLAEVERAFGLRLPLAELFTCPSVARLAARIQAGQRGGAWSPLVPVNTAGSQAPMLCFHPVGGNVICYQDLAQRLGPDQPVYMVQSLGLEEGHGLLPSVEDMAAAYLRAIRAGLPEGPLVFAGWSFGGLLAWEAARQWRKAGGQVRAVLLFDAVAVPDSVRELLRKDEADYLATLFHEIGVVDADELRRLGPEERLDCLLRAGRAGNLLPDGTDRDGMRRLLGVFQNNALAAVRYKAQPQAERVLLVRPKVATKATPGLPGDDTNGWGDLAGAGLELCWMEGNHNQMLLAPHIDELVDHLRRHLDALA
ncbi:MAG: AMP-binding protein, partial [Pseudomonadota bacterium]